MAEVGPANSLQAPARLDASAGEFGPQAEEVVMRGDWRHAPSRPVRAGKRGSDAEELAGLLDPVVRAAGMDLESVRVSAAGRRRLLRVVVDCDGGAGLDEIAEVSRKISARLDASGAMGDAAYTLEVSSPGIDRPLTEPRHWRRARGRLVAVPLAGAVDGTPASGKTAPGGPVSQLTGRVAAASDAGVTLEVDGGYREFTYSELGPGRVQVEFGRPGEGAGAEDSPVAAPARPADGGSAHGH
jgi:ribosome maturation factor RimP